MDKFFLRYSLQQSCAVVPENKFDCYDILNADMKDVAAFIDECSAWQERQAALLAQKYKGSIDGIKGKSILFVGDSMTADRLGYRGIVTKAAELNADSIAFSGATSTDMLRYSCERYTKTDIVSVMIGTNDAYFVGERNMREIVSRDEYRRNIKGIFELFSDNGAEIIAMTVPPMHEERYFAGNNPKKTNNNENISLYSEIVREEAELFGIRLADISERIKAYDEDKMLSPDGIHLSPAGQAFLADIWLEEILKPKGE